jgi:DNA transformation protein
MEAQAELRMLPNIGATLARKLEKVGIANPETLINTGSEKAIIRITTLENCGACINMLYALEGAILGIRWHNLSEGRKLELREFYHQLHK